MLVWTLGLAVAAPGRSSALLPGLRPEEAGRGHVGLAAMATPIAPEVMAGVSMGFAPTDRAHVHGVLVQHALRPFVAAGALSARFTAIDRDAVGLGFTLVGAGARDFLGERELVLAGSLGLAMRFGSRDRHVDLSVLPVSVLWELPEEGDPREPFLFPTPFVFSAGWNRRISDAIRLRTGWPEGIGIHVEHEAYYVDVSAMAPGAPLWGNLEFGARF